MKKLILILSVLALSACASSGVMVDQSKVSAFKEGVTTEADVYAALGKPTSVTTTTDSKIVSYVGSQVQVKGASFIPVVGLFAGGADSKVSVLSLIFKGGVLTKISNTQTTGNYQNGSGITN